MTSLLQVTSFAMHRPIQQEKYEVNISELPTTCIKILVDKGRKHSVVLLRP